MSGEKKCAECKAVATIIGSDYSNRPTCRSCYLRHLKRLLAIYGGVGLDDQRAAVLAEIRKVEEDQQ